MDIDSTIDLKAIADSAMDPVNELSRVLLDKGRNPRHVGFDFLTAGMLAIHLTGSSLADVSAEVATVICAVPSGDWPASSSVQHPQTHDMKLGEANKLAQMLLDDYAEKPASLGRAFMCEGVAVLRSKAGFSRVLVTMTAGILIDGLEMFAPLVRFMRAVRRTP